jgi:hypothetical protein
VFFFDHTHLMNEVGAGGQQVHQARVHFIDLFSDIF